MNTDVRRKPAPPVRRIPPASYIRGDATALRIGWAAADEPGHADGWDATVTPAHDTPVRTRLAIDSRAAPPRDVAIRGLRALVAALGRSARTVETRTGFTNAQLFLLRQLATADAMSVNDLAFRAHTNQSTVSSVLGRLVRAGLVTRVRAADDGRRAEVSLTTAGRKLLRRAPTPPTESLFDALEALTDPEARALAAGLVALLRVLGLELEEPPMLFEDAAPRTPGRG